MKNFTKLFIVAMLSLFNFSAVAQDVIVKKDNSEIQALVLRISDEDIEYKKWSNQNGPTYSIAVTNVASIRYANGDVDQFDGATAPKSEQVSPQNGSNVDIANAIISSEIAQQKAKFRRVTTIGGFVSAAGGIGTGIAVISSGASTWAGVGAMLGVMTLGITLTAEFAKPYRRAVSELESQLKSQNLSLSPTIIYDEVEGQYHPALTFSINF